MPDVAALLAQSRAAHAQSFQHRGRIDAHGRAQTLPQLQSAGASIQNALSLRLEAHALDPDHLDPAWLEDTAANKGVPSDVFIGFLGRYLTPDEART